MSTATAIPIRSEAAHDADKAVVTAILSNDDALATALELLRPADFSSKSLGLVFWAAVTLSEAGQPVDAITVVDCLRRHGYLKKAGGEEVIHELASNPVTPNVEAYAGIVRDSAIRRELASVGAQISALAKDSSGDSAEVLLDKAQQAIFELDDRSASAGPEKMSDFVGDVLSVIDARASRKNGLIGVSTGYEAVDEILGGFVPGDLILVAGRPSMGKSAFVLGSAVEAALRGVPTLLFSLEMDRAALAMRILSRVSGVWLSSIVRGELEKSPLSRAHDRELLQEAAERISAAPLWIDDSPGLSIAKIRSRLRRWRAQNPGEDVLVAVDYLQLLTPPKAENRTQEVSKISAGLKALAREFQVPMVALSQLSRSVEHRIDNRPRLSDLRESGSLEQDADVVILLHRPEYYVPEEEARSKGIVGCGEAIVAKHRNGPVGSAYIWWDRDYAAYRNAPPELVNRWRLAAEHERQLISKARYRRRGDDDE